MKDGLDSVKVESRNILVYLGFQLLFLCALNRLDSSDNQVAVRVVTDWFLGLDDFGRHFRSQCRLVLCQVFSFWQLTLSYQALEGNLVQQLLVLGVEPIELIATNGVRCEGWLLLFVVNHQVEGLELLERSRVFEAVSDQVAHAISFLGVEFVSFSQDLFSLLKIADQIEPVLKLIIFIIDLHC